jgi:hypothetical protein
MTHKDEIAELSEEVGQQLEADIEALDPRPPKDHPYIEGDKAAGTGDPKA